MWMKGILGRIRENWLVQILKFKRSRCLLKNVNFKNQKNFTFFKRRFCRLSFCLQIVASVYLMKIICGDHLQACEALC